MYIPKAFQETRTDVLHALMRQHSFALLVTTRGGVTASHLPFLLDPGRGELGTLRTHLARANPQWQAVDDEGGTMVVFQGPHAYISPSWYQSKQLSVPTWNYTAVHAYGRSRIVEDPATVRSLLKELVDTQEATLANPWKMEGLPDNFLDGMQKNLVGIEMEITRLEGKFKLDQSRMATDRQGVVNALHASGEPLNEQVAKLMEQTLPR